MKKLKRFLSFCLAVLLLALIGFSLLAREFFTPLSSEKQSIRVDIPPGSTAQNIGDELEDKGIIRHGWSFRLLVKLTKTGEKLKSGEYLLSPTSTPYDILETIVQGKSLLAEITIPEGFTLKQISFLLSSRKIVDESDFLQSASDATFVVSGTTQKIHGLEGLLFPDTYNLAPEITPEQAYGPMLDRFKEMVVPLYLKSKTKMSLKSILTLASLVEREAKVPKERPLISAVYYNRLKKGIPLQCDATIQYLLPSPTVHLTDHDFKIDSPYNTYLYPGLPPAPIANPGLPSIEAALHPAHVPYLYYVAKGDDGSHRFSTTYAQQMHAVRLYEHWLAKQSKNGLR